MNRVCVRRRREARVPGGEPRGARAFGRLGRAGVVGGLLLIFFLVWGGIASAASASLFYRGAKDRKQIALTFDDNTSTVHGLATLHVLEKYKVPATLFVIGNAVTAYPALSREIASGVDDGLFEVGDHTLSHVELTKVSAATVASQIGAGTEAFRKFTGVRTVPLFRPPYGSTNSTVSAIAGQKGFTHVVLWDVDPRDWAGGSGKSIEDAVVSHAHNGAVVVMHLSAPHTAEALPGIITRLRAKGYELVGISQMIKGDRAFADVIETTDTGKAILRMAQAGIMTGYDANYFGPADTITRAQVAKVVVLTGGLHTPEMSDVTAPTFVDVLPRKGSDGNWLVYPFDYVEEAAAAHLVEGARASDGALQFNPNGQINRLQLAQILARMARQLKGYPGAAPDATAPDTTLAGAPRPGGTSTDATAPGGESPSAAAPAFTDVPDYARADVALVAQLGLMTGYGDGRFGSGTGATRGLVALTMSRFLDLPAYTAPGA